ncbi:MAG: hypothetical protein CME31_08095 [Gimesia sp.]|uniref:Uncharacterized protein n=1 Tax=Gimesia maris TaxID=122 RepID=A0A3D3R255_9PLAN|nr:hypothetical protein [Gimesia sp.]HCO22921.1 hypothetical protein [Gimesia maris]
MKTLFIAPETHPLPIALSFGTPFGMIRCHRRYASKRFMISLGVTGVILYASMPIILYLVVVAASGARGVR